MTRIFQREGTNHTKILPNWKYKIYASSVVLQPAVGLGLLCNTPPSLSIPFSISPFVYSHLSQVRGHVVLRLRRVFITFRGLL